jgi:hypothetical protein
MDRAGQLKRVIKGKRTYRIIAAGADNAPITNVESSPDSPDTGDMDYDQVASALLVQVVQTLSKGSRGRETDGSWARRRIQRLERGINDLERDLSQAKAESKTLAAERDQLVLRLEHSEGNLALLADRLSTGKPRAGQVANLLRKDELALLDQLRSGSVNKRRGRAS